MFNVDCEEIHLNMQGEQKKYRVCLDRTYFAETENTVAK